VDLFNRLLATLLAILLIAGGALLLAASAGWLTPESLGQAPGLVPLVAGLRELPGMGMFWTAAGSIAAVLAGSTLLALELRPPRAGRELLISRDKFGAVTVSMAGLRRLAEHVIRGIEGVEAVASEARRTRKGLEFHCRVAVAPEANSVQLAGEMRERLASAIQNHLGREDHPVRIDIHTQVGALAPTRRRVR
jgi:hypothetical protein